MDQLMPEPGRRVTDSDTIEFIRQSGEEFEPLNRLAAYICRTSVSLVNLFDQNFQYTASKTGEWEGQTSNS